ncbi:MAG: endonuclease Q family protein [Candidatus Gracilibacteria bacterium]
MLFVADLHIHSKYSRATSGKMDLENLYKWAQMKGIKVMATGDFTHPIWFKELRSKLEPAEYGLFKLKPEIEKTLKDDVPESCRSDMRFMLTSEVSSIYTALGKGRRVHNLIAVPSFEIAEEINKRLSMVGNLMSDGRPILGLPSDKLAEIVFMVSEEAVLVPAHIWTPYFSVFGSMSGFDSLEECFGKWTDKIFAIETGLSSDPAMNWRLSALDKVTLISNSDSHSLPRIGREANVFDTDLSYTAIWNAVREKDPKKFLFTIEFFPEEGRYHFDGHAACHMSCPPEETRKYNGICPKCSRKVTVGVLNRVEKLADREVGFVPKKHIPYKNLVSLDKIIADAMGFAEISVKVQHEYLKLIYVLGNELKILLKTPIQEIAKISTPKIAEGVLKVREGKLKIVPGYDGEYGKIKIFSEKKPEGAVSAKANLS